MVETHLAMHCKKVEEKNNFNEKILKFLLKHLPWWQWWSWNMKWWWWRHIWRWRRHVGEGLTHRWIRHVTSSVKIKIKLNKINFWAQILFDLRWWWWWNERWHDVMVHWHHLRYRSIGEKLMRSVTMTEWILSCKKSLSS